MAAIGSVKGTFPRIPGNDGEAPRAAIRGANLFECLAVAEKRWVDKRERCRLHRTRCWRDFDLSTNLLEQGGIPKVRPKV